MMACPAEFVLAAAEQLGEREAELLHRPPAPRPCDTDPLVLCCRPPGPKILRHRPKAAMGARGRAAAKVSCPWPCDIGPLALRHKPGAARGGSGTSFAQVFHSNPSCTYTQRTSPKVGRPPACQLVTSPFYLTRQPSPHLSLCLPSPVTPMHMQRWLKLRSRGEEVCPRRCALMAASHMARAQGGGSQDAMFE